MSNHESSWEKAWREGRESFHAKIDEIVKGIAHVVKDQDHRQNFKGGVDEACEELIQRLTR